MPDVDRTAVLVVEDNEANRDMLVRRLRRRGLTVESTEDAVSGIAAARRLQPALILMDMSLPGLDGWAATRQLKADPATAHIRIVALTAHAMSQHRDLALEAGCDEFETKPVHFERLLATVKRFLESDAC